MTATRPHLQPRDTCSGATLVEVMIACIILAIMAIGSAAYLHQSRANLVFQRNRRIALESGNARLEDIRTTTYTTFAALLTADHNLRYLTKAGGSWQASSVDPGETTGINGTLMPLTTTVRYIDVDGGSASFDCLEVTVSVAYRMNSGDRVQLQSLYAP